MNQLLVVTAILATILLVVVWATTQGPGASNVRVPVALGAVVAAFHLYVRLHRRARPRSWI